MFHAYPPQHCAGAEMMAHALLRDLVRHGHQVDVLLSKPHDAAPEPYDLDGVQVHPFRPGMSILDHSPHVLVTHLENTPHVTVASLRTGVPMVTLLHNTMELTKWWVRPHSRLVFNSQWMQADYQQWFAERKRLLPEGIVVRPPVDAAEYRTTPGDRVTLINLFERKGAPLFWRLARLMPDVQFLAVEGAYGTQDIRDRPNVEVIRNTPNVRDDVYARTRILLVPSVYESWGRVAVEAMACGIPAIAHPTPGLLESLAGAGTFADRDHPNAWTEAIRALLQPEAWAAASSRALERSAELDPAPDYTAWHQLIEDTATVRT